MGLFLSIHGQSGPVEAPEEMWVLFEKVGIGAIVEVKLVAVRWIVVPEASIPTEIR